MGRKRKESRWDDIDGGAAFVVPYTLLRHPNFTRLSAYAHKLLMDLACQYTGFNNGYLCAAWTLMRDAGWKSENTMRSALLELEHYQLVQRTRQGGRNRPNLHAFTWRRIDNIRDRPLDVAATNKPNDLWKVEQPDYERTEGARKAPKHPAATLRRAA
ncbi:hypothetical protein [Lysobacter enzymogenes]|uniref:hypothetical protein n=1 Tax=Lysobacter enzymogenes TaxID=69 RepID=UPI00099D13B4|nr:hypothetical protein [Lysobacter enzymogenes]UZW60272.1 hypothetical protein BV903_023860 [Lysobacter enzymogenes]